jgi:hypothetical protein
MKNHNAVDVTLLEQMAQFTVADWIRRATTPDSTFVWLDITYKLERKTPRHVRLPARKPLVRQSKVLNAVEPEASTWKIDRIEDDHVQSVRVRSARQARSLADAAKYNVAGVYRDYLPIAEPARAAIGIVNWMGTRFFKGRSRRANNPERLVCVIGVHDLTNNGDPCRPHVHLVIRLPEGVSLDAFASEWKRALDREPFAYRRTTLEPVEDLSGAVDYIADPAKSSIRTPIVYVHLPTRAQHDQQPEHQEPRDVR